MFDVQTRFLNLVREFEENCGRRASPFFISISFRMRRRERKRNILPWFNCDYLNSVQGNFGLFCGASRPLKFLLAWDPTSNLWKDWINLRTHQNGKKTPKRYKEEHPEEERTSETIHGCATLLFLFISNLYRVLLLLDISSAAYLRSSTAILVLKRCC